MNLELQATYECNLQCEYCNRMCDTIYQPETHVDDRQMKRYVRQIERQKYSPIKRIKVAGGEPACNPWMVKILDQLNSMESRKVISKYIVQSNGTLPLPQNCKHLRIDRPKNKRHTDWRFSPYDLGFRIDFNHFRCSLVNVCGVSLDCYGWLPCSRAYAISCYAGMPEVYKKNFPRFKIWCHEVLCANCICSLPKEAQQDILDQNTEPTEFYKRDPEPTMKKLERF